MPRRKTIVVVSLFAAGCLVAGILWTVWIDAPLRLASKTPKGARLRIEVWEPGRDMATVSMSLQKRPLDTMLAFGLDPKVSLDHLGTLKLREVLRKVSALPPGKRLEYRDHEATVYLWIDTPTDSTAAPGTAAPGTAAPAGAAAPGA